MSKQVGIDLGSTYSLISTLDSSGLPYIVPNALGKELTPSVVYIKNDEVLVGESALTKLLTEKEYVVESIKRSMGDDSYKFQGLSPTQLSVYILKKLKIDAEQELQEPISEAVITVPAYFNARQRLETREAGRLAGLKILDLPNEPTAAALFYGTQMMKEGDNILVYDLGGGTFDSTILNFDNNTFVALATAGSRVLGGRDWTKVLYNHFSQLFYDQYGKYPESDPIFSQNLYNLSEKAKRDLSQLSDTKILIGYQDGTIPFPISQKEFNKITEHLIYQTLQRCEDTLEKAGLLWLDINHILLVGGSSRLPAVKSSLFKASGLKPIIYKNPAVLIMEFEENKNYNLIKY